MAPNQARAVAGGACDPRWLTAEEQRAWRALNGVVVLLPFALDAQLQQDHDLTLFEYAVLSALSEAPGRAVRMKALAALANGSLSRLSHVVARLESRGLVAREPLPEDGRTTVARLTDAGWAKVVDAAPSHVETVRSLVVEPLSPTQVRQLGAIAGRILQAVGVHCDRPTDAAEALR
jgi:DNA-binding MarR family transcriptional regulator